MSDNILDKIIQSQEEQKRADLSPQELVNFLLKDLTSREKEIIKARYGLDSPTKQTLESIGKKFNITRERVRQIENNALKKAKAAEGIIEKLDGLLSMVLKYLKKGGYIRHEDSLMDELLGDSHEYELDSNRLKFIFQQFLIDYIEPVSIVHTEKAWKLRNVALKHYAPVVEGIKKVLEKKDTPLQLDDIVNELQNELTEVKELAKEVEDFNLAVHSCLEISKHFKKNLFDKWGMYEWRSVNPKRMRDKIYLVLLKDTKPLHYKRIAERINEEKFDSKIAHPATIHNELILDNRFVLIGRGIYALQEWGYKPGVIADVIAEVLKEAGRPLTKEEITKEVLRRRVVKEGSINLTLSDHNKFERVENNKYKVKNVVSM